MLCRPNMPAGAGDSARMSSPAHPCTLVVVQETLVLRTLLRPGVAAQHAELAGHELAALPRLRHLTLDCVRCPQGPGQLRECEGQLRDCTASQQHTPALAPVSCAACC